MSRVNITLLSIQIRAAAATARIAELFELSSWLISVAEALERKFDREFVK